MTTQTVNSKKKQPLGMNPSMRTREIIGFILGTILVFTLCYVLQVNTLLGLFLLSLTIYFKYLYLTHNRLTYKLLNPSFFFVINFTTAYWIAQQGLPIFYLPYAAFPMLATLLFPRLTIPFLLNLASAVSLAFVFGNKLLVEVLFLISGILSITLVVGARRRFTIIKAGLIIGFVQALSYLLLHPVDLIKHSTVYSAFFLNGLACSIIVLGTLSIFEYLFKTITNITLLELSDFNQPLLHRLMLEVPGTYHHSLIVGNLSEAACEAINANALLARIGAYYHDIGKLEKPEYFSENQDLSQSKHDELSPTMSKLVIMNHVKEGIELAKRSRLNPAIINFIHQHHGNSLVYYFYRRALESVEEDEKIQEEGFRYPGPKPNSKETAVVLLADSVEAATRALKEPNPSKIEEVVHKIINNKFIDGQLDECDLTLKDLEKIAKVFIRILNSIYHARITYPEANVENNHKKPAKENSHQSDKDKEVSS
ncbi:MAG: HDIG domain-containing metalloprotein [Candidatus Omnitrophota bacterium]